MNYSWIGTVLVVHGYYYIECTHPPYRFEEPHGNCVLNCTRSIYLSIYLPVHDEQPMYSWIIHELMRYPPQLPLCGGYLLVYIIIPKHDEGWCTYSWIIHELLTRGKASKHLFCVSKAFLKLKRPPTSSFWGVVRLLSFLSPEDPSCLLFQALHIYCFRLPASCVGYLLLFLIALYWACPVNCY
jgi:hypothetical protein